MATRRTAEQTADETPDSQTKAAEPLPAPGKGPLAGYPTPPGATHWRVHQVSPDGRIREAMSLSADSDGQPITRYPIASLGDAAWWDALPTAAQVRVVFTRYHGDQLKARLGQGPIWTVPSGGERVAPAPPPPREPPQPPLNSEAGLFLVLRDLQREARMEAQAQSDRYLASLQSLLLSQAQNQRDFYDSMTRMFVGERGAERLDQRRERDAERRAERERIEALRGVVRDELSAAREREEDQEDEEDEARQETGDAIAKAVSSLGETVKPLVNELGKRAVKAVSQ